MTIQEAESLKKGDFIHKDGCIFSFIELLEPMYLKGFINFDFIKRFYGQLNHNGEIWRINDILYHRVCCKLEYDINGKKVTIDNERILEHPQCDILNLNIIEQLVKKHENIIKELKSLLKK